MELLAEGAQLAEELRQIVDYTQGGSLARLRINNTRRIGCDVDVCMVIMHVCAVMTILKQSSQICIFYLFSLENTAFFVLFIVFLCSRRWSSFVWNGCRLTNSCVRLPRATDQLTGTGERGGREEAGIIQKTMPMPPLRPCMAVALTTAEGVDAGATTTALDMVGISKNQTLYVQKNHIYSKIMQEVKCLDCLHL